MELEKTAEQIAKNDTKRQNVNSDDSSEASESMEGNPPELPENIENMPANMQGGPMGGEFPGNTAMTVGNETNEWLVPMTATGIISGTIILSAVAVCLMIWFTRKKPKS